jgi:hypothetical protein
LSNTETVTNSVTKSPLGTFESARGGLRNQKQSATVPRPWPRSSDG